MTTSTPLALFTAALFAAAPTLAKPAKAAPKAAPKGASCPAQHEVNTTSDKALGCQFAVPAGFVPATAAEFDKQTKGTTPAQYQATSRNHSSTVLGAGNGGIRCPKYYKTSKNVTLYRLYDSRPGKAGKYGGYWTFHDDPHGTSSEKDAYRANYAICTDWSSMDSHVACKLKKGVVIQAGPGESVHKWDKSGKCDSVCKGVSKGIDESYKAEKHVQVALWNADKFCDK